ncbi:fimbria/pilus periplasmic chaperone [Fusobacterium sp.]|uniref:fimbria/pilus periplasmic chaperone n=1 Tax=Fusobacterium sp. TaxID=68766 RepID=UPI00290235F1|nr:fimbria/pilus periplasmic chaperone [Fusobacterium sp.]MDU1910502.1 fimbria/pilus periplasmic chaperone [Fusobacterium sp.]
MKKIFTFLMIFTIGTAIYALNFSVAPTSFQVELKKPVTQEVYIINNTPAPLRIETYLEAAESFDNFSLNNNITVFPKMISIKPGSKQTIRFRVKPEAAMKDGEYKSLLVFKEVPQEIKTIVINDKDNKGLSTEVSFITEVAIGVSGIIGKTIVDGTIENIKISYSGKILSIEADTISKGNTAMKINYILENESGKIIAEGRFGTSARTGEKNLSITIETPELNSKKIKLILKNQNDEILYTKINSL